MSCGPRVAGAVPPPPALGRLPAEHARLAPCRRRRPAPCLLSALRPPLLAGGASALAAAAAVRRRRARSSARASADEELDTAPAPRAPSPPPGEPPPPDAPPSAMSKLLSLLLRGEETAVLLEAGAVGLLTGGAVVLLNDAVHATHAAWWGAVGLAGAGVDPGSKWPFVLVIPVAAGAAVSALRAAIGGFDAQDGESETSVQATLRPAAKATAAALTLGAGVPLGPEGPSVQIGSAVATALQRISPSSEQRRLSLLAAGSAAGLSAGFGTTLAGAFFAVEAVLQPSSAAGRPSDPPSLTASMVLLSAVLASVVSRAGLGASPTFIVPQYDLNSLAELPLFLGLGAAAGGIGIAFSAATSAAADAAATLEAPREDGGVGIPSALMPPLGGLLAGTVALLYPEILYNGFDNADAILANPGTIYSPALLLQLVGAKLVTTAACRASGLVGGFYAPALFMGAALGAAYGQLAQHLPFADVLVVGSPEAYALVGMAATLAAVCRVPLTAILLLFEYTQDFRIIVPLMASVGVAAWVASVSDERASTAAAAAEAAAAAASEEEALERAQAAGRASVRAVGDRELGTALGEDALLERILRELPVSRAMRKDFLRVPADASLLAAGAAMVGASERAAVLTGPDGRAVGVLTHNALQRALREAGGDSAAASAPGAAAAACARSGGSFNPRAPGAVHPDTPLAEALAALNGLGVQQLPVVARDAASAAAPPPVGLLEAEAVGTACALELTQRALRRASLSPPGSGKGKGGPGATPPGSAGGSSQHAGGSTPQSPQSPQAGKVVSAAAALEEGSPGPGASTAARRLFSELAACDAL